LLSLAQRCGGCALNDLRNLSHLTLFAALTRARETSADSSEL
jgi:hypothetical protein